MKQGQYEGGNLLFKLEVERANWNGAQFVLNAADIGMTVDCPRLAVSGPFVGRDRPYYRKAPIVGQDGKLSAWRYGNKPVGSDTFIIVNL